MSNDDGFLSRWSRRKSDVREGRVPAEPSRSASPPVPSVVEPVAPAVEAQTNQPAPTLADVEQLTPNSNFASFVANDVSSEVKNAAMKKLFADPHFNVMDGMDVYIDDYNQISPLPKALLRQMVSAKTLNLFDDVEPDPTEQSLDQEGDKLNPKDSNK